MIHLTINDKDPSQLEILNQIRSKALAHQSTLSETPTEPVMIAYGEKYIGLGSIREGLSEINQLHEKWYECRCDKFEFE